MANKYHISDDGTPGICRASTSDACPKTQAGDNFHGNLAEAKAESERRFEERYGAAAHSTLQEDSKSWSKAAGRLSKESAALYRAANPREYALTHEKAEKLISEGLGAIHGVSASAVRRDGVHYLVEESNGVRRVYGDPKGNGLSYLGILHPKLESTAEFGSESKFMLNGREAEYSEIKQGRAEHFSYATVNLKNHGPVEFTTDKNSLPTKEQVWASLDSSKVPRELFEDESLRIAIANKGILREKTA